jgi:hypothetical protein
VNKVLNALSGKAGERKKMRVIARIMLVWLLAGATLLILNPAGARGGEPPGRYSREILDSINATTIVKCEISDASPDSRRELGQDLSALRVAPVQTWESISRYATSVAIGSYAEASIWTQGGVGAHKLDFIFDDLNNGGGQSVRWQLGGNHRTISGQGYFVFAQVVSNQSITSDNTGVGATINSRHNWGTNF